MKAVTIAHRIVVCSAGQGDKKSNTIRTVKYQISVQNKKPNLKMCFQTVKKSQDTS